METVPEDLTLRIKRDVQLRDLDSLAEVGSTLQQCHGRDRNALVLEISAALYECQAPERARIYLEAFDPAVAPPRELGRFHRLRLRDLGVPLTGEAVADAIGWLSSHRSLNRFDAAAIVTRLATLEGAHDLLAGAKALAGAVLATDELAELIVGRPPTRDPVDARVELTTAGRDQFEPAEYVFGEPHVLIRRSNPYISRPTLALYRLRDVDLYYSATGIAVTRDGRPVSTLYNDQGLVELAQNAEWSDIALERRRSGILAIDMFSGPNYCHWIFDSLHRIISLVEAFGMSANGPDILVHGHADFYERSLARLGVSAGRTLSLTGRQRLHFDELYVSSSSFRDLRPPAQTGSGQVLRSVREALLGSRVCAGGARAVFISRKEASRRRVLNEPDLEQALGSLGFETVVPGELSFEEQIASVSNADIVVGCHGAGQTNHLFARPESTLIEIFPPAFSVPAYYFTSKGLGQRYICMHGGPHGEPGRPAGSTSYYSAHDDYEVDVDRLTSFLATL